MLLFIFFLFGVVLFYSHHFFPVTSLVFFMAASSSLAYRKKALLIPVLVFGILYAFLRFSPSGQSHDLWNKEIRMTGRFVTDIKDNQAGNDIRGFAVEEAFDEESGEEIDELRDEKVHVITDSGFDYDDKYELLVKTGKDRTRLNPGEVRNVHLFGKVKDIDEKENAPISIFHIFERQRNNLNAYLFSRFREESAALVSALITGETAYLGEDIREAFNVTGLAHILSISGTHFGLFSVLLFGFFMFVINRLPYGLLQRLTIYMTPAQAAALLCIPFMLMYLGISGGSVPAVRSFVMISLFLVGLLIGRKGFWLNSLLLAAVILVIWDPGVILSLSFQLSFIAVLFIGFSVEKKEEMEDEEKKKRLPAWITNSLRLTLMASVGTAPLVAYHFHYFSVISPLTNLLIAPFMGFVLIPLSLISSFSFLFTGHYIFAPLTALSADISISIVKMIAGIPFVGIKVPSFPFIVCIFFYAGFIPYLITKKKKTLMVPFVPLLLYTLPNIFAEERMNVTFLDVGQGDSAVITLPDKRTIVVDTGRTGKETSAYLKYAGKKNIDALVLTHVHPDHTGGLEHVLKRFNVKEIWDNGSIEYPEDINTRRRSLQRGDVIKGGYYTITVVHPYKEFYTISDDAYDEENNSSVVIKLNGKNRSFLFAGDIGEEAEEDMSHIGKWLASDVIKVPHHGSRTSLSDEFLSEVSPSIAVISAGRDNSFGHPNQEILEKLKGRDVFRTDLDGAIKITETEKGLAVKTYKDFAYEKADSLEKELRNIKRLFSTW